MEEFQTVDEAVERLNLSIQDVFNEIHKGRLYAKYIKDTQTGKVIYRVRSADVETLRLQLEHVRELREAEQRKREAEQRKSAPQQLKWWREGLIGLAMGALLLYVGWRIFCIEPSWAPANEHYYYTGMGEISHKELWSNAKSQYMLIGAFTMIIGVGSLRVSWAGFYGETWVPKKEVKKSKSRRF